VHRFSPAFLAAITLGTTVVAFTARTARAGALSIDTASCPALDAAEIDRRVQLELADVARAQEGTGALRVAFACDDGGSKTAKEVTVTISDPVTDKRVERRVPMPPVADRERVLALVASQLFVTSWLELLTHPSPEARPAPTNPPSPEVIERAKDTATTKAGIGPPTVELGIGGLVDVRALLDSPVRMMGAFVRPSFALGNSLRFELGGSFAVGQATRARGVVDTTMGAFGLGLGFRSSKTASLTFDVHTLAALAYARAVGNAASDAVIDATTQGFFVDLSLAAGPSLRVGSTYLGLELAGGVAFPKLRAAVAGDSDVTLSGMWLGARLSIGAGWGGR
jgi:hypothetical protein